MTEIVSSITTNYKCDICNYSCNKNSEWTKHCLTKKHQFRSISGNFSPPTENPAYLCEKCNYTCKKPSDWSKHLLTIKHKLNTNNLKLTETFFCNTCKHSFQSYNGLWHHNKKYHPKEKPIQTTEEHLLPSMFLEMMKQNEDFKKLMIEQNEEFKKVMLQQNSKLMELANNQSITNNNINNTMNNKFNLNFFLNETCKDAMNIQEFIDYVKVQHSDFENFGKYGYVESMTRIIMRNLMELEVHRRPIHCTDAKREVLYVKDNNVWINDFSREKLIRAIKYIAAKNVKQIPDWMDHNPDSKNTQTKLHDKYMRMVCHSMGGRDEAEDQEYYKKIIRNVAKEVIIDKMK